MLPIFRLPSRNHAQEDGIRFAAAIPGPSGQESQILLDLGKIGLRNAPLAAKQSERLGTYKLGDDIVGVDGIGASAQEVPYLVDELLAELNGAPASFRGGKALTIAAYAHAKLVGIHPFVDGNGRVARLLMNRELLRRKHPPVAIRKEQRLAYYGALDAFHREGDLDALEAFLKIACISDWGGRS